MPIGLVVSLVVGTAWATWNISASLSGIDQRLLSIESQMQRLESDRIRKGEMRTWAELLKARNPDLKVPEVR